MRAGLATNPADRMTRVVMMTSAALAGVVALGVALPLAVSSPYPTAGQGNWIIQATIAQPTAAPEPPATAQVAQAPATETAIEKSVAPTRSLAALAPPPKPAPVKTRPALAREEFVARWKATGIPANDEAADEQPTGTVRFALAAESTPIVEPSRPRPAQVDVPAEAARIKPQERKIEAAAPKPKPPVNPMDAVDDYLWQVYMRAPVKKDGTGDFTWKDPAAAKRMHLTLKDYVIRGMDADFREQLYHAGHAMDAAGLRWSMLSAFRDDYRQALAAGFKARPGNSLHGGSRAVGGYGNGRAIDINNTDGGDEQVWHWLDAHGARYGLRRPMPGYDPAHIQAGGDYRRVAAGLRDNRTHTAAAAAPRKPETQASVRSRRPRTAM
jgi:hypothetical protein